MKHHFKGHGAPGRPRAKRGEIRTSIPIVAELFTVIKSANVLNQEISILSNVKEETMRRWRLGISSPTMADFDAVLNAIGYKLKLAPLDEDE